MTFRLSFLTLPAALLAVATLLGGACTSPMRFRAKGTGGSGGGGTGGASLCTPGEKVACYDGPTGTEGQGLCRAGTQVCDADGAGFGPCEGQVLPAAEDCATPVDEDCDGLAPSCEGLCLWSKGFGDDQSQSGAAIALDPTGALVVAGLFSGSMDLGGGPLQSQEGAGAFVAKLDPKEGGHLWSKGFGGSIQSFGAMAPSAAGDVVLTGTFNGAIDFGGGAVDGGGSSTFVVRLDADGAFRWARIFKGGIQAPQGVAVDAGGDVVVIGSFLGTTDFGAGPVAATAGAGDGFLVKLQGSTGAHLWGKTFGDAADQAGVRVVVDPADGNLIVAGVFLGAVDFGAGPMTNEAGGEDVFVAKLATTDGQPVWTKQFRGDENHAVFGLAADPKGSVAITGTYLGTSDLGGAVKVKSAGGEDIYVTKLAAADGSFVWTRSFGQEGDQSVRHVALDGMGNVVLTGQLSDDTDFGGGPLAAAGLDVFVVKLDALAGKHIWSKRFGDSADQAGQNVTADADGNVFLTGFFKGAVDFGCGKLTSAGSADAFAAALSP